MKRGQQNTSCKINVLQNPPLSKRTLILLARLHSSALLSDDPATGLLPRSFKRCLTHNIEINWGEVNLPTIDGWSVYTLRLAKRLYPTL